MKAHPVNESIREIDSFSWVIADRLLLSRQCSPAPDMPSWADGNGSFYVLSEAMGTIPKSRPLPRISEVQIVYDAGAASAVWRVGEAFVKVKKVVVPDATREHVTLEYLHRKSPLGFCIPNVHYHAELDGRYYVVLSRLPGQALGEAWPNIDEPTKEAYVDRIVTACKQLALWNSDSISGVDGCQLSDLFLTKLKAVKNCDSSNLLESCTELGMDCSSFFFYHCDLGPGNIIVAPDGSMGVLDWETAGFVPKEWVRTKFWFSSGMDLPLGDEDERVDWRRRVSRKLGDVGFPEIVDRWWAWWHGQA